MSASVLGPVPDTGGARMESMLFSVLKEFRVVETAGSTVATDSGI